MPRKKKIADSEDIDIVLSEVSEELLGQQLAFHIGTKGFCVVDTGLDEAVQRQIHEEVSALKAAERFSQPPDLIAEGLLGSDGSARIAEVEQGDEAAGEGLRHIEALVAQMGENFNWCAGELGLQTTYRTTTVVHESGVPEAAPDLAERDAAHWLETFQRHKIMAIAFAGPMEGILRLQVFDDEDADLHDVRTRPGLLVLCRPDLMSHKHMALGKAVAITSFFLTGGLNPKRHPTGGCIVSPVAEQLDAWTMNRIREMKTEGGHEDALDLDVPREWQKAMNLNFFTGHSTAIQGIAGRFPGVWGPELWYQTAAAGPDMAVEVPLSRWDHQLFFDENPECWKYGKTFTRHGGFCEGFDLFDNKLFGISVQESKGMDPNQRLLLEVGYESLISMGHSKKTLLGSNGSVYAGNQFGEIGFVDIPEECRGCGPTGAAGCIAANRISFIHGLKGPSMGVDTDGASGLTALYMVAESVQKKGQGKSSDFGIGAGCATMLTVIWWHQHCGLGWMSYKGRCFTFDASADGYMRAEACISAGVRPNSEEVDGEMVLNDMENTRGVIVGAFMNQNGSGASLAAPNFAATQELIAETVRCAGIASPDVDWVEVHGSGLMLGDVVDACSVHRAHRPVVGEGGALSVSSAKTLCGDTMASAGLASFMRVLIGAQHGYMAPSLHLREANPHMDYLDAPLNLLTESLEVPGRSNFSGCMARGFGGTNAYCISWGAYDDRRVRPTPGIPEERQKVHFWPAGGGYLEGASRPETGYSVVGSFSSWGEPQEMEEESVDVWTFPLTLGENGWEQFQIWIDGDSRKVLHPGRMNAPKSSPVLGPDDAEGCGHWVINGIGAPRTKPGQADGPGAAQPLALAESTHLEGRPGDRFRVRLRVAGKFRMLDWEKESSLTNELWVPSGRYFLAEGWNAWELRELEPVPDEPGLFRLEVTLPSVSSSRGFLVVRNHDWNQVFHPDLAHCDGSGRQTVFGPDVGNVEDSWRFDTMQGSRFLVEFQRRVGAIEEIKLSWKPLPREA